MTLSWEPSAFSVAFASSQSATETYGSLSPTIRSVGALIDAVGIRRCLSSTSRSRRPPFGLPLPSYFQQLDWNVATTHGSVMS